MSYQDEASVPSELPSLTVASWDAPNLCFQNLRSLVLFMSRSRCDTFQAARKRFFVFEWKQIPLLLHQACRGSPDPLEKKVEMLMKFYQHLHEDAERKCFAYWLLDHCDLSTIRTLHRRLSLSPAFLSGKIDIFELLAKEKMVALLAEEAIFGEPPLTSRLDRTFYQAMWDCETDGDRLQALKLFMDVFRDIRWWAEIDEDTTLSFRTDDSIFQSILKNEFGPASLRYFVSEFFVPEKTAYKGLNISSRLSSIQIDTDQAVAISKMLPCLKELHLDPLLWTRDGIVRLLRSMATNTTIYTLHLSIPSSFFLSHNSVQCALQNCIFKNKTLQSIQLFNDSTDSADDAFLKTVLRSLPYSSSINSLKLQRIRINDPKPLVSFLSSCQLSSFSLEYVRFLDNNNPPHWIFEPQCKLQNVEIIDRNHTTKVSHMKPYRSLLSRMGDIPTLKNLRVSVPFLPGNLEKPILRATRGGTMESLHLPRAVPGPILKRILQANPHLQELEMDEQWSDYEKEARVCLARNLKKNVRLCKIRLSMDLACKKHARSCIRLRKKIQYLALLNKLGRSEAMRPNITLPRLVELLAAAATHASSHESTDLPCDGIPYGLLRIAPHVWSNVDGSTAAH